MSDSNHTKVQTRMWHALASCSKVTRGWPYSDQSYKTNLCEESLVEVKIGKPRSEAMGGTNEAGGGNKPVGEDTDSGEPHVQPNDHVTKKHPRGDQLVVGRPAQDRIDANQVTASDNHGGARCLQTCITSGYVLGMGQRITEAGAS